MNIVHEEAKKNVAYELRVPIESQMVGGDLQSGETVADEAYYKDGAGAWATLAITDTFSEIGSTGVYECSLTAAEMNHDWIMVKCTSNYGRDAVILIRTTDVDINDMEGFFQLTLRGDAAIETDRAALLAVINADEGSGAGMYSSQSDSNESIRDRGDAAWGTGGGGSLTQSLNVTPTIPASVDLANTAAVRLGLILFNTVDDLPSTAEITPGTVSIERRALKGTSWTAVVTDAAMSEQAGMVYYDEVFDAATGYAEGDSLRITFKSVSITADVNTYEVCDSNGIVFYSEVRQDVLLTLGVYDPPTKDELQAYVQLLARSDAAIVTDRASELAEINANEGSGAGDYSPANDSGEAIRDNLPDGAAINAQVVDVLKVDTIADLSQGAPPATPTFEEALMYVYSSLRNRNDVDTSGATDYLEFYNNAGVLIWRKALTSDGVTYSEAQGISGA